jgi:alpha-beta hydrolase superfamily lysophospholipase
LGNDKTVAIRCRFDYLRTMKTPAFILLGIFAGIVLIFAAVLYFSAPKPPAGLDALDAPFRTMDFSTLPPVGYWTARDKTKLAYRAYPAALARQTVILIHGSTASSRSMHALAEYLRKNDMDVYTLDMRGHGDSGRRGDVDYIGQLEDDLEDFMTQFFRGRKDVALVGFSSGGGFVLRFAAGSRRELFHRYVVLAPFIRYDHPTTRPDNGRHARASVLRIVAITLLDGPGQKYLGHLPVVAFGVPPETAPYLTAAYSYRLWANFGMHRNYSADLKSITRPLTLLVGAKDELFDPQKYLKALAEDQPHAEIRIVPDVGHTTLATDPAGLAAIAEVLQDKTL